MELEGKKAILFDLDDTLISFDGVADEAWEKCCETIVTKYALMFTSKELFSKLADERGIYWNDPEKSREGRKDIFKARIEITLNVLKKLGIDDYNIAQKLVEYYSEYRTQLIHIFPGTVATLKKLKEKGYKLGLITNGETKLQYEKLNRFNLLNFFDIILIEQEVGIGKPDERIYTMALEKLHLKSDEVCMVGDNLIWDVETPQKLGIYAIWNDYKNEGLKELSSIIPDKIINSVSELV